MERLNVRREALGAALALAAAAAVVSLALDAGRRPRVLLPAIEADDAAALSARDGLSLADILERAKVLGVGAVILRDKPASYFQERGELLRFGREEVEKWRAAGLVAPGFAPKPGTLWLKERLLPAALERAARRGLLISTSAAAGYAVLELKDSPEGFWPGPAPELAKAVEASGLAALRLDGPAAAAEPRAMAIRWRPDGRPEGASDLSGPRDLLLAAQTAPADADLGTLLRAAHSHPRRLLVARLSAAEGADRNFERLRRGLRALQEQGIVLGLPPRAPLNAPPPDPWKAGLGRLAGWLLGVLGPLFAARAGLLALKRTRTAVLIHWPVTSPVLQLAAGLAATGAAAVGMGLAARVAFDISPRPASDLWAFMTMVGPVLIGLLTLFTIDLEDWAKALARPMSYGGAVQCIVLAGLALFLLAPRAAWIRVGGPGLPGISALGDALWWLPWRWRETLLGIPCLLHALFLVNWRMDSPDSEGGGKGPWSDPRGWFLAGLLGPAGVVAALGRGRMPTDLALAHTAAALVVGTAVGGLLIAARLWWLGPKDLDTHRTIVPDAKV